MKSCKIIFLVSFVLALCCQSSILAQQNPIDSLINLSRKRISSEELLSINNQIANRLRNAYPDSSIRYYRRSLELSKMIKSDKDYIDGLSNIGVAWGINNNFDSAKYYTHKSIELSKASAYKRGVVQGLNNLGLFEIRQSKYKKAMPYFFDALKGLKKLEEPNLEAKIFNNLGLIYKRMHKYDSSLFYYLESLKIKEVINDYRGIAITTSNIALVYEKLGEFNLSIEYLERSLLLRKQLNNEYGQGIVYNNLGLVYEHKENYDTALIFYQKALSIFEKMDRKSRISTCYNNIGTIYANLEDYKKAISYLERSLQINIKTNNINGQANSYLDMAEFYAKIRNFSKSIKYYKQSIFLANKMNNVDVKIDGYSGLYSAYEAAGNADSALHYYRFMREYKDSLEINDSKKRVELLEIQYQTLKKDKENEELVKANQINRSKIRQGILTAILLAVLLFFFIIITFVTLYNRNKIKKAMQVIFNQKNEIEEQSTKLEQTYKKMKGLLEFKEEMTGMIVHDLKNPINTIINIADIGNDKENTLLVKHSAKRMLNLVMNILDIQKYEDAGFELQKQNTELRYVFFKVIEEVKFYAQLKAISINIPKSIDYIVDIDVPVFERILVNLLTNALKFAPENTRIEIKYELIDKSEFKIHIIDKGPGVEPLQVPIIFHKYKQAEKKSLGYAGSTGIGLTFCKMAIESHGGKIGVDSKQKVGSDFWLRLPYLKRLQLDKKSIRKETDNQDMELYLSYHIKEILKPHISRISGYLVYQISDIRKELNKLQIYDHQVVSFYVEKLNEAVLACDENRYKNLINLVLSDD